MYQILVVIRTIGSKGEQALTSQIISRDTIDAIENVIQNLVSHYQDLTASGYGLSVTRL